MTIKFLNVKNVHLSLKNDIHPHNGGENDINSRRVRNHFCSASQVLAYEN